MANEKVLVVEDDLDLAGIMEDYLKKEGFAVRHAYDGESAVSEARSFEPSLVILDIMLPKMDGIEVCRQIRQASFVPIVIISAKSSDLDKLVSLGMGADDYLTKPFSLVELVARVKSHIRRYVAFAARPAAGAGAKIICGALVVDPASFTASVGAEKLPLTAKEFRLLDYFCAHPSQVFSREQLLAALWGTTDYVDDNTVAVTVGRLREKLAKANVQFVKTVWGVGYKWEK
ncbi:MULTISPECIES: response regulator transcription factor [unclassified Sporolactobacillus]|uniref:response regulator transcription factor n=1 Tax=unclassified Sporolactobacillus TaxID=2628533 RepID=UPI002367A5C3|nr:response regulator transcription factor [Sporolactobacillus sp. CQH2019]MDD9149934.1 response regulator transcription factor [Sporolactobacillus sp. CQH2019]